MSRYRKSKSHDFEIIITLIATGTLITLLVPFLKSYLTTNLPILLLGAVILLFVVITLSFLIFKFAHRTRKLNLALSHIDHLSGRDFELYVSQLLTSQGFAVRVTGGVNHGDYGVDIVAERENLKTAVQVKRWNWPVGIDGVYQVVAGAKYYQCAASMVVTNSTFTPPAINLARANSCELVDRTKLKSWLIDYQAAFPSPSQP